MGILSNLLTKEPKPLNRIQEIKKSFKEKWYNKELDSLYNTKQHTPAERLLHHLVAYNAEIVSSIVSSSKDITILTCPTDYCADVYNITYDLSKIFSLGKNCERDVFNLCINISKVAIMICNNLDSIDMPDYTAGLLDIMENALSLLGDYDIKSVYNNKVSYDTKTLELLSSQLYQYYVRLYLINKNIVYNNKVYRNQLKYMVNNDFNDI